MYYPDGLSNITFAKYWIVGKPTFTNIILTVNFINEVNDNITLNGIHYELTNGTITSNTNNFNCPFTINSNTTILKQINISISSGSKTPVIKFTGFDLPRPGIVKKYTKFAVDISTWSNIVYESNGDGTGNIVKFNYLNGIALGKPNVSIDIIITRPTYT